MANQKKTMSLEKLKKQLKKQKTSTVSIRLKDDYVTALEKLSKELRKDTGRGSVASICQTIIEDYIDLEMSAYKK